MRSARLTPFIVPDVPEVRVLSWLSVLLARCEKSDRRARETSSGGVSRKGETLGPFGRPNEEKSVASCHARSSWGGTVPPFLGAFVSCQISLAAPPGREPMVPIVVVPPLLGLPSSSADTLSSQPDLSEPSWNPAKDADPSWNALRSDPNWVAASKNLWSAEDDDEVQWQCVDDFPAIDGVLGEGVEHASDEQRCEAGNLLLDGNTYLYNKGRETDVENGRDPSWYQDQDKPGICKLSGCWCCVRKQRPLPRGRDLVLGTSRCDFEERFGNVSEDKWSMLRPAFIASKANIREALGVPDGFRTCAVVGSSGKLLQHKQGNMIDDHEMVMRMNTAPTDGWEQHTGARTTHRVVATTGLEGYLREANCLGPLGWGVIDRCLVDGHAAPWCPVGAHILNSFMADEHQDPHDNGFYKTFMSACSSLVPLDFAMDSTIRHLTRETVTGSTANFMTGMAGLLMAAMLCDDGFDVYGFDTGDEPEGTPYHFFNDTQVDSHDNFGASKALLKEFAAAQPSCIRLQGGSEGD